MDKCSVTKPTFSDDASKFNSRTSGRITRRNSTQCNCRQSCNAFAGRLLLQCPLVRADLFACSRVRRYEGARLGNRASHRTGDSARHSAGQCVMQNRPPSEELNWTSRPNHKAASAFACARIIATNCSPTHPRKPSVTGDATRQRLTPQRA